MLYPKYNPTTYYSRDLYEAVSITGDLRLVWAKVYSLKWNVDYDSFLKLCYENCPICDSKLNYGLGNNNKGKKDYETPSTDHKNPRSEGGARDCIENIWVICERCNRIKSNATPEDAHRFRAIAHWLEESSQCSNK